MKGGDPEGELANASSLRGGTKRLLSDCRLSLKN